MLKFEMYQIKLFPKIVDLDQDLIKISSVGARSLAWSRREKKLTYIDPETGIGYHWSKRLGETAGGEFPPNLVSLVYDAADRLLGCDLDKKSVIRIHEGEVQTLCEQAGGAALDPRAVAVHSCGVIYVSSPAGVYMIMPENLVCSKVTAGFETNPACLCLSGAEDRLFYADPETGRVRMMDFTATGGFTRALTLVFGNEFPEAPADIKADKQNRVYCAASDGVHVYDGTGLRIGNILIPGAAALSFGGDDGSTLFVAADGGVYTFQVKL